MQRCLDRLGVPLKVAWAPNKDHEKHGLIELSSRTLFLFDEKEEDAWETFTHELLEYRFKGVCETYRTIINSLIEVLEKVAYKRKEEFLEFIPQILEEVKKGHEQD
jgi:hypothetical protein